MRRLVTMTAALAIIVGACSSGDSADAPLATAPPATSAGRSTTTTARVTTTTPSTSTTTVPTTTTLPPTTVPPTPPPTPPPTTAPALPVPLAAPPEDGSTDPRIELGTIEIPRLGLTRSMFEGIRLATLNDGPGHWPGTAMPGELGNVVVAGHRVSHNKDFRNLDQLTAGDEVIMSTVSGRFVYRVISTEIVPPDAIWIVDQMPAHTATLFACHPPGSTRERIVVHLELA